ncbi:MULTISPECIES: ATP-dependent DNA helicase [Candidatus Ichthyocystis]|uniref:ATP-dependent DNA helicase n=1 Tax=Candidatus Ichthyocystis TaxID=2929841 RepID=UPI000B857097|nr:MULTISPECIES: AAA family ATPase [Ichthyocystis]
MEGSDIKVPLSEQWIGVFVDWSCRQVPSSCSEDVKPILAKYIRSFCKNWLSGRGEVCVLPDDVEFLLATGIVSDNKENTDALFLLDGLNFSTASFVRDKYFICEFFAKKVVFNPVCDLSAAESVVRLAFTEEEQWTDQMQAVYTALIIPWVLITGGPGTGKTTTLVGLLTALQQLKMVRSVALCAPTGKATMNLVGVLNQVSLLLNKDDGKSCELKYSVKTIHSLLGYPYNNKKNSLLDFDVIIVDEASMMDISLIKSLLNRIGCDSRLVLVGDSRQLGPIHGASIFRELVREGKKLLLPSGLCLSSVINLRTNYRFLSREIPVLAESIISSNIEYWSHIEQNFKSDVEIVDYNGMSFDEWWVRICDGYSFYEDALRSSDDVCEWFFALFKYRVLCAVVGGMHGVTNVNKVIGSIISRRLNRSDRGCLFFSGTPLMVVSNTPDKGLYNGDVGVFHWESQGPGVSFMFKGGRKFIPWRDMPPCKEAWAVTVHKAQGSQFSSVAILLPDSKKILLSRVWLYTAVTRAKEHVLLCGSREQLSKFFL